MDQTQTETTETEQTSPLFEETAQAIIDKHMQDLMEELNGAGVHAHGVVVGVLHDTDTSTSWCVSEDAVGPDGKPVKTETIVRSIVTGIASAVSEAEDLGEG